MDQNQNRELFELLSALREGTLDESDFARLDRWLVESQSVRRIYLDYFSLCGHLRAFQLARHRHRSWPGLEQSFDDELLGENLSDTIFWQKLAEQERTADPIKIEPSALVEEIAAPVAPPPNRITRRGDLFWSLSALAALVTIISTIHLVPLTERRSVAILIGLLDATWQSYSGQILEGDRLYPGEQVLKQGLARIRFHSGVQVVIEAPAVFELKTDNEMYLCSGKLTAQVMVPATGFTVETPNAQVVDFGTEFGVSVSAGQQTEAHVFRGSVRLQNRGRPDQTPVSLPLSGGQAGRVADDGSVQEQPYAAEKFVNQDEYVARMRAGYGLAFDRWRAFTYELHRDPSLRGHLLFGVEEEGADWVTNEAPAGRSQPVKWHVDNKRQAPERTTGRWGQCGALRFERGRQQALVIEGSELLSLVGPITVSVWVRFPSSDHWGGHLLSCRDNNLALYQLSIFDTSYEVKSQRNRIEFIRYEDFLQGGIYSQSLPSLTNRWHQVAVSYDRMEVRYYVDGALLDVKAYRRHNEPVTADLVLGALRIDTYRNATGNFDGIVDEILIFDRALSAGEIQRIYQQGNP